MADRNRISGHVNTSAQYSPAVNTALSLYGLALSLLSRVQTGKFLAQVFLRQKTGARKFAKLYVHTTQVSWGHIKNIHLHRCKHKTVKLGL